LRDFEVPMSDGFYMVEYMEELEEFFEIGKEVVCYTGPEDLVKQVKYYLRHDSERERIRRAGHERCLRDHTWQKRFEMAFKQMGMF
jgi:spore maturation protein CgeB